MHPALALATCLSLIAVSGCATGPISPGTPTQPPGRQMVDPGFLSTDTYALLTQLENQRLRNAFLRAFMQGDANDLNQILGNIGAQDLLADARATAQRAAKGELTARDAAEATRASTRINEEQRWQLERQLQAILDSQQSINERLNSLEKDGQ